MIVDYFNVDRTRIRPSETDPILVIDPDAVLTATISPKRLQAVPGRYPQVVEDLGLIECVELPRSHREIRQSASLIGLCASNEGVPRSAPTQSWCDVLHDALQGVSVVFDA